MLKFKRIFFSKEKKIVKENTQSFENKFLNFFLIFKFYFSTWNLQN